MAAAQQFATQGAVANFTLWHFFCDAGTDPQQDTSPRLASVQGIHGPCAFISLPVITEPVHNMPAASHSH